MTDVKRPILLQVRSLHEVDESPLDRGSFVDEHSRSSRRPNSLHSSIRGTPAACSRPLKTQSLDSQVPSCRSPPDERFPVVTNYDNRINDRYSNSIEDETSPTPSIGLSTSSPTSSSSGSIDSDAPSLILPYLYVGDQDQTQIDTISNLNISYILSLQSLPKFLSDSPEVAAPNPPPVAEFEAPELNPFSNAGQPSADKIDLRSDAIESSSSLKPADVYDIIDGGDGGLLPSVNSSRDYLVKIKPSEGVVIEATGQHGEQASIDAPYSQSRVDIPALSGDGEIKSHKIGLSPGAGERSSPYVNMSEEELDSFESDLHTVREISQIGRESVTNSSSALGCSLKQRCNRLSSSVHRLIRGKCINISDTFEQLLDKFFDETHNFIEEARRNKCNVLVHCKAGISRSPTIAIAYLMKWKRLHLNDAYNFVKRCRPQISPNLNFMGQLVSYERQLQRDRSQQLPSPISCCLPNPNNLGELVVAGSLSKTDAERAFKECEGKSDTASPDQIQWGLNGRKSELRCHDHKRARVRNFFSCKPRQSTLTVIKQDAQATLH